MYSDPYPRYGLRAVFPLGVVVTMDGFNVTYGENGNPTRLIRSDGAKLAGRCSCWCRQAWDSKLTTSCGS